MYQKVRIPTLLSFALVVVLNLCIGISPAQAQAQGTPSDSVNYTGEYVVKDYTTPTDVLLFCEAYGIPDAVVDGAPTGRNLCGPGGVVGFQNVSKLVVTPSVLLSPASQAWKAQDEDPYDKSVVFTVPPHSGEVSAVYTDFDKKQHVLVFEDANQAQIVPLTFLHSFEVIDPKKAPADAEWQYVVLFNGGTTALQTATNSLVICTKACSIVYVIQDPTKNTDDKQIEWDSWADVTTAVPGYRYISSDAEQAFVTDSDCAVQRTLNKDAHDPRYSKLIPYKMDWKSSAGNFGWSVASGEPYIGIVPGCPNI